MKFLKRNRSFWLSRVILSFLVMLTHEAFLFSSSGRALEYTLSDYYFRLRGPLKPPSEIVIVGIDAESYKELNLSPLKAWPRSMTARLKKKWSHSHREF